MGSEQDIEIELCKWFQEHNIPCYYNRQISSLDNPNFFRVTGSKRRPDLLIHTRTQPVAGWIAIEVKDARMSRNVYDSSKIADYEQEYRDGAAKYFVDDKEVRIQVFAIATQFSKSGKIYNEDQKEEPKKAKVCADVYKTIPPVEFIRTKDLVRQLMSVIRRRREKNPDYNNPGMGVILSGVLNENNPDNRPYIFCMYKKHDLWTGKGNWGQQWKSL